MKAFQESIESGIIGVNTGSTVSEITQTSNGYDGGAKALLLCPITDSPSFFNGTIKWSNLFYVNVFCNKNNVEISQVFKLQGDSGAELHLYKVTTDDGDWVAFIQDYSASSAFYYDCRSSHEIKLIDTPSTKEQITTTVINLDTK